MDEERGRLCGRVGVALLVAYLAALLPQDSFSQAGLAAGVENSRLGDRPLALRLLRTERVTAKDHLPLLVIEDIHGRSAQPIRINVFVNRPDADRTTPMTDAQWAGVIQLLPREGIIQPTGAIFDLSAQTSSRSNQPISITLVPVVGSDSKPTDVNLTIGHISICDGKP